MLLTSSGESKYCMDSKLNLRWLVWYKIDASKVYIHKLDRVVDVFTSVGLKHVLL